MLELIIHSLPLVERSNDFVNDCGEDVNSNDSVEEDFYSLDNDTSENIDASNCG